MCGAGERVFLGILIALRAAPSESLSVQAVASLVDMGSWPYLGSTPDVHYSLVAMVFCTSCGVFREALQDQSLYSMSFVIHDAVGEHLVFCLNAQMPFGSRGPMCLWAPAPCFPLVSRRISSENLLTWLLVVMAWLSSLQTGMPLNLFQTATSWTITTLSGDVFRSTIFREGHFVASLLPFLLSLDRQLSAIPLFSQR